MDRALFLKRVVDKERYLDCDLHLHPEAFFHQFSPHLAVESVSVFLSPLVLSLTCLVSVFSIFRPGIFSCAQIIVMKTSSDFSRQFVVIWTPKFIHWFVVVYTRGDVQSFFVFVRSVEM